MLSAPDLAALRESYRIDPPLIITAGTVPVPIDSIACGRCGRTRPATISARCFSIAACACALRRVRLSNARRRKEAAGRCVLCGWRVPAGQAAVVRGKLCSHHAHAQSVRLAALHGEAV